MEKKCNCSEENMSLPDEIVMSLRKYGGIVGLLKSLPDDETLASSGEIHKALSDPIRLKIISMLSIQPLCVCVLKAGLGITDSRLSYHLSVMRKAGLIEGEQQGNWIIYGLTEDGKKWAL